MSSTSQVAATRSPLVKRLVLVAILVAVLIGMALDTTWLNAEGNAAVTAPTFSSEAYVEKNWPQIVSSITDAATPLSVLAPALAADPGAARKQYGTDLGAGKFSFPVTLTGKVTEADANFLTLEVPEVPADTVVRVPIGAALSGSPIRDATGKITFSDFVDQTQFQSVANQLKIKIQAEVISKLDAATLAGKEITVIGSFSTGGPPNAYTIQPVSIKVAP